MTVNELAIDYQEIAKTSLTQVEVLKPLLHTYTGSDLRAVRRKIKTLKNFAMECERLSKLLLSIEGEKR